MSRKLVFLQLTVTSPASAGVAQTASASIAQVPFHDGAGAAGTLSMDDFRPSYPVASTAYLAATGLMARHPMQKAPSDSASSDLSRSRAGAPAFGAALLNEIRSPSQAISPGDGEFLSNPTP